MTRIVIILDIEGDADEAMRAVELALDNGVPQDEINETLDGPTVASALADFAGPTVGEFAEQVLARMDANDMQGAIALLRAQAGRS